MHHSRFQGHNDSRKSFRPNPVYRSNTPRVSLHSKNIYGLPGPTYSFTILIIEDTDPKDVSDWLAQLDWFFQQSGWDLATMVFNIWTLLSEELLYTLTEARDFKEFYKNIIKCFFPRCDYGKYHDALRSTLNRDFNDAPSYLRMLRKLIVFANYCLTDSNCPTLSEGTDIKSAFRDSLSERELDVYVLHEYNSSLDQIAKILEM